VFIYHFHRIIRHRIVWGVFAVAVSLAFLSVDSCYQGAKQAGTVAEIGKESVGSDTFAMLEREIRGLFPRRRQQIEPSLAEVATQVWHQVAAFQVARELKLGASREEIQNTVQESIGASEGYNQQIHQLYQAKLRENNLTPALYEQYQQHLLTLRKLNAILEAATWTTPIETEDELAGLTDIMTVRVLTAPNRYAAIRATEAQVQAYFDVHTNRFYLPKRVAVNYVALPASNYLAQVTVPEEQIREYYDDHSDAFTRSNTTEVLPLAEARAQILPILQHQNALQAAYTNLTHTFLPLAAKDPKHGFTTAATAFELPIQQTEFFSAEETPAGIESGKEFRDAAFELDQSQPEGLYNVVQGKNFAYAITPLPNSPSPAHMPTLEEAIARVRPLADEKVRSDKFRDEITTLHADLTKALAKTPSIETLAQAKTLNVSTAITFSVHTLYQNPFPNYMSIARAALHLRPGELSDAVPAEEEEAALFIHMETRHPGDSLAADMLRPKARASLERTRIMGVNASWMSWNLDRLGITLKPTMKTRLESSSRRVSAEE
jgi:hypothetical protein